MKMFFASIVMMFVLLSGFASPVKAQTCDNPTNTTLSGRVLYRSYSPLRPGYRLKPLADFYITATDLSTFASYSAVTDSGGYYSITGLPTCTNFNVQPDSYQPNTGSFTTSYPAAYYVNTGDSFAASLNFEIDF